MNDSTSSRQDVACPFCGLACDDLTLTTGPSPRVEANGCERARTLFARPQAAATPMIAGQPASLEAAVAKAADLIRTANLPLISGLGTDVNGVRSLLEVADRAGAVVDHMHADAMFRNLLVLQQTGWMTTTLTEVRNRADLIFLVGDTLTTRFPRLVERTFGCPEPLFVEHAARRVVCLGGQLQNTGDVPGELVSLPLDRLAEVIAALRVVVAGRKLEANAVAGVASATLQTLAERMKAAKYGVMIWAAADLDFPNAELAVQQMAELIKELNETTRFAGLPMAGGDGDVSAQQVMTWQTGFPMRVSFNQGFPDYDPRRWSTTRLLTEGEADVLVWVSAIDPSKTAPATGRPVILIGTPDLAGSQDAAVFIPVGTPGLHHTGHQFRSDGVATLPLKRLTDSPLPSVAQVAQQINAALAAKEQATC